MEKIKITIINENKNKVKLNVDYITKLKDLNNILPIDENNGGNPIINHLCESIKNKISKYREWSDIWSLSNPNEKININFKVELGRT